MNGFRMPFLFTALRINAIVFLICLSLASSSSGADSRKVEKMIEASEPQTGEESLVHKKK